jgi:hypothetical protein
MGLEQTGKGISPKGNLPRALPGRLMACHAAQKQLAPRCDRKGGGFTKSTAVTSRSLYVLQALLLQAPPTTGFIDSLGLVSQRTT